MSLNFIDDCKLKARATRTSTRRKHARPPRAPARSAVAALDAILCHQNLATGKNLCFLGDPIAVKPVDPGDPHAATRWNENEIEMDEKLTHVDAAGKAHMVDVGDKAHTKRIAVASGSISMLASTLDLIKQGDAKKGDVLGIARIAAIQGSKKTADLIPLCHPIPLTKVGVEFEVDEKHNSIICTVTTQTTGQTGVEMEALTAVNVGLLTIYDMCKAVDRGMVMGEIKLLEKSGGKSGNWSAE